MAALVAAGSLMPVSELNIWGLPLFLAAGALIAWSMQPYRQLCLLENQPDELWLDEKKALVYAKKSIPILSIPLPSIEKFFFLQKPHIYGICISTYAHPPEKIRIHLHSVDFARMRQSALRNYGCDIFLPFFSQRTFQELQDACEELATSPTE